jgi:NAD(P)-dependent dehydrogenase (short-subunit alcohol dehydrogenase family)
LGRAYVLRLARLGADVVVNDINLESHRVFDEKLTAPTVMEEVEALGRRSIGIQADVTKKAEVDTMFETIIDEFGKIDVLVNNAGGILKRPGAPTDAPMNASDVSEEDFLFQFKINFWGTVLCSQGAATYMKEQRSGKIVNIASQAGLRSTVGGGQMPYSIAKAAIIHYTRILAAELGEYNINVNCIAPAFILTSKTIAWGRNEPETRKPLESQIALGRLGWPEDCAKAIEFLVTDLSDYVTGQCIPTGGGYVLF